MSVSDMKRCVELVETALATVARAAGSEHTTVGIWLVWMRARRVMSWEWANRLDVAVPVNIPAGADAVVVVAVAPTRVAGAVIGRVDVLCEQVQGAGLAAEAVHVSALKAGALWTCLRANGFGGIVPAIAGGDLGVVRRRRVGRFVGTRPLRRSAALIMAPLVYVICAMAGYAEPGGQAGVIAAPGPGQAGVTTAPPVPMKPSPQHSGLGMTMNVPRSPAPVPQRAIPRVWSPGRYDKPDLSPVKVSDDTLHVGTARIARPAWLPQELVEAEQGWNGYLAHHAGIGLDEARTVVGAGAQELGNAGLADLAVVAGEAADAAVAEVSAVVGSGEREVPRQGLMELTEIAVATLPQWQNPARAPAGSLDAISTGEPLEVQIDAEVDGWLAQLEPILG
ncbi:hypothetical protein [Nocardia sp. CS682]|uniref:hypothetical protein n=1 Tax=Nocardia sp. CS682 TaxID=1047172 RepID=UPI001074E1E7|nr:hypothetical protein [Nocardia sp. CS682]QBS41355.1 hypothetical protein DMB37_15700 [Nocardia sp. CS682]